MVQFMGIRLHQWVKDGIFIPKLVTVDRLYQLGEWRNG